MAPKTSPEGASRRGGRPRRTSRFAQPEVAERIRLTREKRGLTQEQVAKRLNIATQSYQAYEWGKMGVGIERLRQIADILEVPLVDLLPNIPPQSVEDEGEAQEWRNRTHLQFFLRSEMDLTDEEADEIWRYVQRMRLAKVGMEVKERERRRRHKQVGPTTDHDE